MKKIESRYLRSEFIIELIVSIIAGVSAFIWTIFFTSETRLIDKRFQAKARFNEIAKIELNYDDVVIVSIPEDVLIKNNYPNITPRDYLANIIDKINKGKPRVIGLDYVFYQPREKQDKKLLKTIKKSNNIVIGYQNINTIDGNRSAITETFMRYLKSAKSAGFLNIIKDKNGIVRYYELLFNGAPSFIHEILSVYNNLQPAEYRGITGFKVSDITEKTLQKKYQIPVEEFSQKRLINYESNLYGSFKHLDSEFILNHPVEMFKKSFKNKIVLIGSGGYRKDLHKTPLNINSKSTHGILIQAMILNNIINKNYIVTIPFMVELLVVLILAFISGYISYNFKFLKVCFYVFLIIFTYILLSFLLFILYDLLVPLIPVISSVFFVSFIIVMIRIGYSEKDNVDVNFKLKNIFPQKTIKKYNSLGKKSLFKTHKNRAIMFFVKLENLSSIIKNNENNDLANFLVRSYRDYTLANDGIYLDLTYDSFLGIWNFNIKTRDKYSELLNIALGYCDKISSINKKVEREFTSGDQIKVNVLIHYGEIIGAYVDENYKYKIMGNDVDKLIKKNLKIKKNANQICFTGEFLDKYDKFKKNENLIEDEKNNIYYLKKKNL